MSGHTHIHTFTHTHTHTHTYTHDNYSNPRCAHAHRGLTKISRSAEARSYQELMKTAQHEAHALIWNNN